QIGQHTLKAALIRYEIVGVVAERSSGLREICDNFPERLVAEFEGKLFSGPRKSKKDKEAQNESRKNSTPDHRRIIPESAFRLVRSKVRTKNLKMWDLRRCP